MTYTFKTYETYTNHNLQDRHYMHLQDLHLHRFNLNDLQLLNLHPHNQHPQDMYLHAKIDTTYPYLFLTFIAVFCVSGSATPVPCFNEFCIEKGFPA